MLKMDGPGTGASRGLRGISGVSHAPRAYVAAKLTEAAADLQAPLVYVTTGEGAASRIAAAARCLAPGLDVFFLPPWDCLPYDRVQPSRQCMGQRMDALRDWSRTGSRPKLMITSLDAVLQRVPPRSVIETAWMAQTVGEPFDRPAFEEFLHRTGYSADGLVDEPGEYAFRDDVIDIFPAGLDMPLRIVLSADGRVQELRSYRPDTQRTDHTLDTLVFGPASELVEPVRPEGSATERQTSVSERQLFQCHGTMQTVFDMLDGARVCLDAEAGERLQSYLAIIDEAREAHKTFGGESRDHAGSLYLGADEWQAIMASIEHFDLKLGLARPAPAFTRSPHPRRDFTESVRREIEAGGTVVITGMGRPVDSLCRRIERELGKPMTEIKDWQAVGSTPAGSLCRLARHLEEGFRDEDAACLVLPADALVDDGRDRSEASRLLLAEPELKPGDVVVHEDHGVGILKGIESVVIDGLTRDAARLEYRDGASVLVPMQEFGKLWRYGSKPQAVTLDRLHTDAWARKRQDIASDITVAAKHLLSLAKASKAVPAEAIVPPAKDYAAFVARFAYTETADQAAAISAVLEDLASGTVMNRLLCGDVGFGKTEVALRAAAAAALAGRQVIVVSPTTVLTRQHFLTFERRFAGTSARVAMLSRLVPAAEAARVKAGLASGEIRIVVATQAILAKDVGFKDLGLLIIDEEHRFGTRDKQKLKTLSSTLHVLSMSATPIPRTLQGAMIGIQDVSLLTTPPSRRRPVRTAFSPFDRASMRVALLREHQRGGQSFVVAPQIEDLGTLEAMLRETVPELSLCVVHGKMNAADMDDVMVRFGDGDGDVLLSTNIIESGLDVPLANTIFVWRADRFGLAQLHQLRGRVGRSRVQGMAYLLSREEDDLPEETHARLAALVQNDRLGAGFAISVQDLDLRGGGDIAGADQAGHMNVIGISLYQKLLERALTRLRDRKAEDDRPVIINLGLAGSIPVDYVPDASLRLNLYTRLMRAGSAAEIDGFAEELEDRFGEMPEDVTLLLRLARLEIAARQLRIVKLDAGPLALALTLPPKASRTLVRQLSAGRKPVEREGRLIYEQPTETGAERLEFFEMLFAKALQAA